MFVYGCKYLQEWFYRCHMLHAESRYMLQRNRYLICVNLFLIDSDYMNLVYIDNLVCLHRVLIGYCLKDDLTMMEIESRFLHLLSAFCIFSFSCACILYLMVWYVLVMVAWEFSCGIIGGSFIYSFLNMEICEDLSKIYIEIFGYNNVV